MSDTPKLTEAEAAVLRRRLLGYAGTELASAGLRKHGIRLHSDSCDLGRRALAAFDAEQRAKIRAEMREECIAFLRSLETDNGDEEPSLFGAARLMREQVKP